MFHVGHHVLISPTSLSYVWLGNECEADNAAVDLTTDGGPRVTEISIVASSTAILVNEYLNRMFRTALRIRYGVCKGPISARRLFV